MSLLIVAVLLALQAAVLIVASIIFTFSAGGPPVERLPGLMAVALIAGVLLVVARELARARPWGHLLAVVICLLEGVAFGVSLIRRMAGVWGGVQLAVVLVMLLLLFVPGSRRAIQAQRDASADA